MKKRYEVRAFRRINGFWKLVGGSDRMLYRIKGLAIRKAARYSREYSDNTIWTVYDLKEGMRVF